MEGAEPSAHGKPSSMCKPASLAVLSRVQLTPRATRPTPHVLLRAWREQCLPGRRKPDVPAPSRRCRDARVHGHTTATMCVIESPRSAPPRPARPGPLPPGLSFIARSLYLPLSHPPPCSPPFPALTPSHRRLWWSRVLPYENNVTWNCEAPDLYDPSGIPTEVRVRIFL